MVGGSAASFTGSYCSFAVDGGNAVIGIPPVVKDRSGGCRPGFFAIRIESRIGLRRNEPAIDPVGLVLWIVRVSSAEIGGGGARSFRLTGECDKKERAVSQI